MYEKVDSYGINDGFALKKDKKPGKPPAVTFPTFCLISNQGLPMSSFIKKFGF